MSSPSDFRSRIEEDWGTESFEVALWDCLVDRHLVDADVALITPGMVARACGLDVARVVKALMYFSSDRVGALRFRLVLNDAGEMLDIDDEDLRAFLRTNDPSSVIHPQTGEHLTKEAELIPCFRPRIDDAGRFDPPGDRSR